MPRKPLARAGDVVQVQGLIAADRLYRAPTIARKGRQAPSGARRGAGRRPAECGRRQAAATGLMRPSTPDPQPARSAARRRRG
ncbi:hypothetical protein XHV734_p0041 (plasmid) [Xanthomonas hortorum pv. vitians]|nr:hypothetical protein XHV734_p0041 [Xanthomonas hortorum pv. vitians]